MGRDTHESEAVTDVASHEDGGDRKITLKETRERTGKCTDQRW
jgi:hypothetical protein